MPIAAAPWPPARSPALLPCTPFLRLFLRAHKLPSANPREMRLFSPSPVHVLVPELCIQGVRAREGNTACSWPGWHKKTRDLSENEGKAVIVISPGGSDWRLVRCCWQDRCGAADEQDEPCDLRGAGEPPAFQPGFLEKRENTRPRLPLPLLSAAGIWRWPGEEGYCCSAHLTPR